MCLFLCAALLSTSALADQALPQAQKHYRLGQKHYRLARFEQALTAFSKAYEYKPRPDLLFNIGQCHKKLKDYSAFGYTEDIGSRGMFVHTPGPLDDEVQRQAAVFKARLTAARGRGEVLPGQHTLTMDWRVGLHGRAGNEPLLGPAELTGTSLSPCLSTLPETNWRFPAATLETQVRNFPVGPITVP